MLVSMLVFVAFAAASPQPSNGALIGEIGKNNLGDALDVPFFIEFVGFYCF